MDIKLKGGYTRMTGWTTLNHPEYDRGFRNGQQSKQAEIDALKQKNQRLAMRLDVIQGALQKQIDLIVELKNDT